MAKETDMLSCASCGRETLHLVDSTNHLLHWVLVVLTAGFWLIIYGFILLFSAKERVCTVCGKRGTSLGIGTVLLLGLVLLWFAPDIVNHVSQKLAPLINVMAEGVKHLERNVGVFEFFLTLASFTTLLASYIMLWHYNAFSKRQVIATTIYWLLFSAGLIFLSFYVLSRLYQRLQS